jgi:peptidoglycan hydrolase-like protein with peptidoglycan-binding domain
MREYPALFSQTNTIPVVSVSFSRDLTLGSVGEDVRTLQKLLNERGFTVAASGAGSPGYETEYFGLATRNALMKLQESISVSPVSGYFGPLTRQKLTLLDGLDTQSPAAVSSVGTVPWATLILTRDLTVGMTGDDVRMLQDVLIKKQEGASAQVLAVSGASGYFGVLTKAAVAEFQSVKNISPTSGYVGTLTRSVLEGLSQ